MSETIDVTIGGENIQVVVDGGNMAAGSSVAFQDLNQAVADAEQAATSAVAAEIAAEAAAAAAQAAMANKAEKAATLAALASVPASQTVVVTPLGEWRWVAGNQSANVTADPEQGVWVAPTGTPSGASGAWQRVFSGPLDAEWFGGRTSTAINAALAYAKATALKAVVAVGDYVLSETVEYEGGTNDGISFDGSKARFTRSADYGPTFYVHGVPNGAALQKVRWVVGQITDANRSMTVATSRSHVVFDTVYFLEWACGPVLGGSGGVELLGCSSVANLSDFTPRFDGPYKPGSVGFDVGVSELPGFVGRHGGDIQLNGLIDVYGGTAIMGVTGSTSGSSTTVTVSSGAGIANGDLIAGIGLEGANPYALIPQGTTVTNVVGNTVTISTAVTLPGGTDLVFYRPAIEDGFRVSAVDGLWGKGFVHSIYSGRRSISITPTGSAPVDNVRLDVMPDFAPGTGFYMAGAGIARHGYVNVHHAYADSVVVTANRQDFTVESQDERWSLDGFRYGGTVQAPKTAVDGMGGFAEREWRRNGSLRYNLYMDNSAESGGNAGSGLGLNVHDDAGAYLGTAWSINRVAKTVKYGFPPQQDGVTVASLSGLTYPAGTSVYCVNCRVLQSGGALQGPGAGTGSMVTRAGDNNWYVVGTNILAQA